MAFEGFLIRATNTGVNFPLNYIQWDSYDSTPKQREEIKAYRDENTRDLYRVTAQGMKSKIKFTVKPGLHLADKMAIQNWFTSGETNAQQRKIPLTYWNDETNQYETADFYRPDINFKIRKVLPNDLIYDELEITLVEY